MFKHNKLVVTICACIQVNRQTGIQQTGKGTKYGMLYGNMHTEHWLQKDKSEMYSLLC